jgi:hypothetical protein
MTRSFFWRGAWIVLLISTCMASCIAVQYPSQKRAQDLRAAATVRRLVVLEEEFYRRKGRYTESFSDLGAELSGPIGKAICTGGYCYSVALSKVGFEVRSWPEQRGKSGYRSFYADATQVVRFTVEARPASVMDEPLR